MLTGTKKVDGERLRSLMFAFQMNLYQMANFLNVSRHDLNKALNGKSLYLKIDSIVNLYEINDFLIKYLTKRSLTPGNINDIAIKKAHRLANEYEALKESAA